MRQQGKSLAMSAMYGTQAQNLSRHMVKPNPYVMADWANPSQPFMFYSEFKPIGMLAGVHAYQVHNKQMTAMGQYAVPVPTLDGRLWCCTIKAAIHALRPSSMQSTAQMPEGHVILWRRSHKLCDVEQGVAALLMLHDRVAIIRSFDQGEKLCQP